MKSFVGPYRIEGLLGHGGMGVVYLGVHDHLGREVAIKALAPELTQHPQFRERFFAEARVQAKLQHMNIVTIYDLIEDGGSFFIVMEHVPGPPLQERLDRGTVQGWDVGRSLGLFRQILAGLDHAHSKGVIHRDVKPSNVLLAEGDVVKLTDFGIALLVGDKRLTASLATIGTPTYMSPEQILRPRLVDHRSDVYSAAIVLYEMLAGRPPFDAETEYEIKKLQIEAQVPDMRAVNRQVPAEIAEAIATALRKDPEERFQSAGAFLRAIERWQEASGTISEGALSRSSPAGVLASSERTADFVPAQYASPLGSPIRDRVLIGTAAVLFIILALIALSMRELSSAGKRRDPSPLDDSSQAGGKTVLARVPLGPPKLETSGEPQLLQDKPPTRIAAMGERRESGQMNSRPPPARRENPSVRGSFSRILSGEPVRPHPLPPWPSGPNGRLGGENEKRAPTAERPVIEAPANEVLANARYAHELEPAGLVQGWSDQVQEARLLLAQGRIKVAQTMAQQVLDGANVPERLRRDARVILAEIVAQQSSAEFVQGWSDQVREARLLLAQGKVKVAQTMARQVVDAANVPEHLKQEARGILMEIDAQR